MSISTSKASLSSSIKLPNVMTAVQLVAHGGLDNLVINFAHPLPKLSDNEVLIKVGAAGVNNTDINTRVGWYSKKVSADTQQAASAASAASADSNDVTADASWSGNPLKLPLIQGADVCGVIVAVGNNVDKSRLGQRVLVRSMQQDPSTQAPYHCITIGSEYNGGFAQYTKAPNAETYAINCNWSDAELASIPCAYSTAESMLHRGTLQAGETVFITGASGGVGSAAIQLAKRRGAKVIAQCSSAKQAEVLAIGADKVVPRDICVAPNGDLKHESVDMVVDLVGGDGFPLLLDRLKRGGRYVTSGAIAGPIVDLDLRTLYLKDLTLIGSTYQYQEVFENLIRYIEADEIKPLVAATYPLTEIHQAQTDFMDKKFVGKLVLVP